MYLIFYDCGLDVVISFDFFFLFIGKCSVLCSKDHVLIFFLIFICSLDDHLVAAHHYPKDQFRCELCPKSYSYRPSLLRHRALIHGELRKYPCENCSKVNIIFQNINQIN